MKSIPDSVQFSREGRAALLLLVSLLGLFTIWSWGSNARASFNTDLSFGERGLVTEGVGPIDQSSAVSPKILARDSRGRVIAGAGNGLTWQVWRFMPDGSLDPSFGGDGEVEVSSWGGNSYLLPANLASGVIRPDGRILLAGYKGSTFSGNARKGDAFVILKQLMPDGSPDPSFGRINGGKTAGSLRGAVSVALRPDGGFLIGAFKQLSATGQTDDGGIYRFTADGDFVKDFGDGEITDAVTIPGAPGLPSNVFDVDVLAGGKILVTGVVRGRLLLMRLHKDGSRDLSFARGSQVSLLPDRRTFWVARNSEIDAKGRIVVTGFAATRSIESTGYGLVLRFQRNGRLDRSFGKDGIARLYATPRRAERTTRLYDVTIDAMGGIWVTGSAGRSDRKDRHAISARYLPSGEKDQRFFNRGIMKISLGDSSVGTTTIRSGNGVFMCGRYDRGDQERFFIKRLVPRENARGSLSDSKRPR